MYVLKSEVVESLTHLEVKDSVDILSMLFPYNEYFKMVHNSIALEENYYKYFYLGKVYGHIGKAEFLNLLYNNLDSNSLEKRTQSFSNSEWTSIFNLFYMFDYNKLGLNAKERFVDLIYLYYKRYRNDSIHALIKEKLTELLQDSKNQDEFKTYILNRLSDGSENDSYMLLSNIICLYFLQTKYERNIEYLDTKRLKEIVISNFKAYVKNNNIDAADVLDENSFIHDLVKNSVVAYSILDEEGRYVQDEYYSIIHDIIIQIFENKKSTKRKAIKDFEKINADNDAPQELFDALIEEKETEKIELFGSVDNYNEFKEKCFEHN